MKFKFYLLLLCTITFKTSSAYTSPGTHQKLTLDDLVTLSAGDVTFAGGFYNVNAIINISTTDTLSITTNVTVKFAAATYFNVTGVMIVNPPNAVLFTAQNTATGYSGVALSFSSASYFKKLTFEYAVSFKISDSSPTIDSCVFQFNNNNTSTSFGNGAISLFRGNPVITNSKFLSNQRAAIQGGSNVNNAPKIINCFFQGNNTTNQNVPQINLGATSTGNDTVKIINCQILQASTNSGGIGFLPIGSVYAVITGNVIKNNRYGLTFNGGSNINALISYNVVDSNNTQGDPNLGGSGISFVGGSSSSHQNSIVTGNLFRWNLWGITIQNFAKPNLGNISNADTSDDGKNQFINNHNNGATPNIDLYNNSPDPIDAQNNYWNTNNPAVIEARIFHQPDNAALGLVNYSNFILPVELINFTATANRNNVSLKWQTASEINSDHFNIERSDDGQLFYNVGSVTASGNSSVLHSYNFIDNTILNGLTFYRIKLVDRDGRFKYSQVVPIKLNDGKNHVVDIYPTIITSSQLLHTEIISEKNQTAVIQFYNSEGKKVAQTSKALLPGNNKFDITDVTLPNGLIYVTFSGEGFHETFAIVKK